MIQMYASSKAMFARRELDWRALEAVAYLVDGSYVADLEVDTVFPPAAGQDISSVLAAITLTNLKITAAGWCSADPMVFVGVVLPRLCGQAVVSTLQNQPLLRMEFPPIQTSAPDNLTLLYAQRGPGWFRL